MIPLCSIISLKKEVDGAASFGACSRNGGEKCKDDSQVMFPPLFFLVFFCLYTCSVVPALMDAFSIYFE
jgi:hypothetical protein